MIANQTQIKSKRAGQKGNRNARKYGFYSGTLSPAETFQLWNITNLEGVDPEIAFIRPRVILNEAKRNEESLEILGCSPSCACLELAEGVRGSYVIHKPLCLPYFERKTLVVRGFSLVHRNGTENYCRESFGNCLPASVRQPPRLAKNKWQSHETNRTHF